MVRGGRRVVWCVAAVLAFAGCGRTEVPPERPPAFSGAEDLPEKLGADGTTITVAIPTRR
ncbi:hypothetical protein GCM10023097_62290 [Streptomyces collinus]